MEIEQDPLLAYEYTAKGNLVAVISNGTAVLGLGNIGALAGKPVMEGKGVLFKRFADIDVFDIEVATDGPGGVHPHGQAPGADLRRHQPGGHPRARVLRDRAPPQGRDEHPGLPRRPARHRHHLRRRAAQRPGGRRQEDRARRASSSPAPAPRPSPAPSSISKLGARRENIILCDRKGVIYRGRTEDMDPYKAEFAADTAARTLAEALVGADVFIGLSVGGRGDAGHGPRHGARSDRLRHGQPRPRDRLRRGPGGAAGRHRGHRPQRLSRTRSTTSSASRSSSAARSTCGRPTSTSAMKLAAVQALAELAREDVPDAVLKAYGLESLALRPRVPDPQAVRLPGAAARAAGRGAGGHGERRGADPDRGLRGLPPAAGDADLPAAGADARHHRPAPGARRSGSSSPRGSTSKILRAAKILVDEGIAHPILLARREMIADRLRALDLPEDRRSPSSTTRARTKFEPYARRLHEKRRREGDHPGRRRASGCARATTSAP